LQWQESGVVLSSKSFAEDAKIVTIFNKTVGKTSGLVKGAKSSIQLGDVCEALWRGRTAEQLGTFKIETVFSPFTRAFNDPLRVSAIESLCFLCAKGLPEKAPHPSLFDRIKTLLLSISDANFAAKYALFEVKFLAEVGYGLDLSKCAVTGKTDNLIYVSPRTGCAACGEAGEKYKDRLFALPQFLISKNDTPTDCDVFCSLQITGHFLKAYFCAINGGKLPLSRERLTTELSGFGKARYG
jgi:DNA repair protein RecO (recombination protein O)